MASPTVNLTVNKTATPMAPAVVNVHIGLFTDVNIRTTGFSWTDSGDGATFWTDVSGLGDTLYNIRAWEKVVDRDLNTGFQWTASAGGGTAEYFLEASGGGDPGIWPFKTRHGLGDNLASYRLKDDGANLNQGLPEELGAGRGVWASVPDDSIDFFTFYVRLSDGSDPDSSVMTGSYWGGMTEGGSAATLNAGEWFYDQVAGRLYVRLADDADPDSKADGWLLLDYDLSTTGTSAGDDWHKSVVEWTITRTGGLSSWPQRFRHVTDPRRATSNTISLATRDLRGYSVSPILAEGTYVFTVKAWNADGLSTEASTAEITVAANTRTAVNIAASGGNFDSLAAAVAIHGATDDIEYVLESGGSETLAAEITDLTADNFYIHVAGDTGTYTITGDAGGECFFIQSDSGIMDGLTLVPAGAHISGECINFQGDFLGFANVAVTGAYAGNRFAFAFFYDNDPRFCAILNCTVGAVNNYALLGAAGDFGLQDTTIAGCVMGSSVQESIIRTTGGAIRCTFLYHDLNQSEDANKSCIRLVKSYACYVHGGNHVEGNTHPAPVNGESAELIRVDSIVSNVEASPASITLHPGAFRIAFVNSYAENDNDPLQVKASPAQAMHDFFVAGNTTNNVGTVNVLAIRLFDLGGTMVDQHLVRGFEYLGNLHVANPAATYASSRQIMIRGSAEGLGADTWRADQNQWADPADYSATAMAFQRPGSDLTLSQWNALANVGTDFAKSTTIDATSFLPNDSQEVTTPGGLVYDLWGNVRGATGHAGAVTASDPGPTEEPAAGGGGGGESNMGPSNLLSIIGIIV
jgi:hypothetical protein